MSWRVWTSRSSVQRKMSAFVFPVIHPNPQKSARTNGLCIRCALIKGGKGRRRRQQMPNVDGDHRLSNLPSEFINEVRRLVRSRGFVDQVKETLNWPYTRFTGIVFQRLPISEQTTDGIPEHLQKFQKRADYRFIDVPPGVLFRAKERSRTSVDTMALRLCVLFETYGMDSEQYLESQRLLNESEEDFQRQVRAWTDVGLSMRTETDLSNRKGAEIFEEDLTDFLE